MPNPLTITPEPVPIAPTGVFYGSVFCSLGKGQTVDLHGHSDFAAVALALFNGAIAFFASKASVEVLPATLSSTRSLPTGTSERGLSAYAVLTHPSWNGEEWSLLGSTKPLNAEGSATGSIDHFDRLLELVLDEQGQPLMAAVRKRGNHYFSVKLGFHRV